MNDLINIIEPNDEIMKQEQKKRKKMTLDDFFDDNYIPPQNNIEMLTKKIEKLALIIEEKDHDKHIYERYTIICQKCKRKGHTSNNCYFNEINQLQNKSTNYNRNQNYTNNTHTKNERRILYLEKILGKNVTGTISDLQNQIKTPTLELTKLLNRIPPFWDAKTLL